MIFRLLGNILLIPFRILWSIGRIIFDQLLRTLVTVAVIGGGGFVLFKWLGVI
jgi:hypothetical protein|tara:strand:- start:5345 stop:5503 length:159 start_codon:yes stop_codon:yes gene_type:complete